jgi:thiol-disulfide isomerase/thioredoxin
VFLHFTATWCPFCDLEMAGLGRIAERYRNSGVTVVLVGIEEPIARWSAYVKQNVSPLIVALHDATGQAVSRYAPEKALAAFTDRAEVMLAGTAIVDPAGRLRLLTITDSKHFDPALPDIVAAFDALRGGSSAVAAQQSPDPATPPVTQANPVRVSIEAPHEVEQGSRTELAIVLDIQDGFHVMSNHPSRPEYIATAVTLDQVHPASLKVGDAVYPDGVPFSLAGEEISTFRGHVVVHVPLEAPAGVEPGKYALDGSVHYQSCSATSCLFPRTAPIRAEIDVVKGATKADR